MTTRLGEQTLRIPVSPPISVMVLCQTTVVEEDGSVHLFSDISGYDAELHWALAHRAQGN